VYARGKVFNERCLKVLDGSLLFCCRRLSNLAGLKGDYNSVRRINRFGSAGCPGDETHPKTARSFRLSPYGISSPQFLQTTLLF
jgi:hypothetical protein